MDLLKSNKDLAIIDGRADKDIINSLKKLNLNIIKTCKCRDVYDSISYHPDIVLHPIDDKNLVVAPNVIDYYKKALEGWDINIIEGSKFLEYKYPNNIAYNVGKLKDIVIHNIKHMDDKTKKIYEGRDINFLDIKQGYSKCSLGVIDENIAITSDIPMYEKLVSLGYEMLLIKPGYIDLLGQEYGFIGGCIGILDEKHILFTGKLDNHPDKLKIINFIKSHNKEIIYLSDKNIIDLGSIFILKS